MRCSLRSNRHVQLHYYGPVKTFFAWEGLHAVLPLNARSSDSFVQATPMSKRDRKLKGATATDEHGESGEAAGDHGESDAAAEDQGGI